ncbi:hypothetical protein EGR_10582 [Echinococcus granulosus]|uniref:Uncharacterized protein n=1 Tax=Echinococcus granulosus TaxID=6210 RepID=W6U207_ECHGR|nr:hypothetical protein EGR_10582 [Echinococcus granulosus]EUB54556.1 hypothetical protein EGR_10582 [Echinococcus granulosus]
MPTLNFISASCWLMRADTVETDHQGTIALPTRICDLRSPKGTFITASLTASSFYHASVQNLLQQQHQCSR